MLSKFFQIFKKPSLQNIEDYYRTALKNGRELEWLAFAVNQRTLRESHLTKELVLTENNESFSWQTAEVNNGHYHMVNKGKKPLFNGLVTDANEQQFCKNLFNELLDQRIEDQLRRFQEGFKLGQLSMRQLETEDKALEWMRVSFEVLQRGIVESLTNPDFLFQCTLFAGLNPKTQKREIRLIAFNLDMTFILLDDHDMRVMIYNKGAKETFDDVKPALIGDYSARKREMLDHLTALLAVCSKGFHL